MNRKEDLLSVYGVRNDASVDLVYLGNVPRVCWTDGALPSNCIPLGRPYGIRLSTFYLDEVRWFEEVQEGAVPQ